MVSPVPSAKALLIGSVLLATSCGTARRGAPFTGEHMPPTPEIALGQRVFDANCAQCHPGGTQGLGPALNNKPLPGFLIEFQVRRGIGRMPGFSEEEVSAEALDALVDYIIWLRRLDWREAADAR